MAAMDENRSWTDLLGAEWATRNAARALEERRRAERRVDDLAARLAAAKRPTGRKGRTAA
jgi:hypothetical protein